MKLFMRPKSALLQRRLCFGVRVDAFSTVASVGSSRESISGGKARCLIALSLAVLSGCRPEPARAIVGASQSRTLQVMNLHAFARLYGVLRWFHPSDAAATVDW